MLSVYLFQSSGKFLHHFSYFSPKVHRRFLHYHNNVFLSHGEVCHGIQFVLLDRQALDSPELGVELAAALYKLFPNDFQLDKTLALIGSRAILDGIREGRDPGRMAYEWQQAGLEAFRKIRAKYLLY